MGSVMNFLSSGALHTILLGLSLGICVMIYFNTEQNRSMTLQQNLASIIKDPAPKDLPSMCKSVSNELKKIQGDVFREQIELKEVHDFIVRVKSMTELHDNDIKKVAEDVRQMLSDSSQLVSCNIQPELAKKYGNESPIGNYPPNHHIVARFFQVPEEVLVLKKEPQLKIVKQMYQQYGSEFALVLKDYCAQQNAFSCEDAFVLYLHIRRTKPKLVIQIEAEHSIEVIHQALTKNKEEDNVPFRLIQISPKARPNIPDTEFLSKSLHEIPIETFQKLSKNDLLFIEGSHVIKKYGETILELVFILPQLDDGVFVHFHKIFLPEDYPVDWMSTQDKQYTEQWLLALFLYRNDIWKVHLANYFLHQQPEMKEYEYKPKSNLPTLNSFKNYPSSMYIQKTPSKK